MIIENNLSDEATLQAVGGRVSQYRLNRNLTQAQLARSAGISLSTMNRIESGRSAQFSNLIRVLRALDLLQNMESLIPEPAISPIQQVKLQGRARKRARPSTNKENGKRSSQAWTWDIPSK
jgi:putative transcriptional regulator